MEWVGGILFWGMEKSWIPYFHNFGGVHGHGAAGWALIQILYKE